MMGGSVAGGMSKEAVRRAGPAVGNAVKGVSWLYKTGRDHYKLYKFEKNAEITHIFSKNKGEPKFGHLEDTPHNRKMLAETFSKENLVGIDEWGKQIFAKIQPDGKESWLNVFNGKIKSGGLNLQPRYLKPKGPKQ